MINSKLTALLYNSMIACVYMPGSLQSNKWQHETKDILV